MHVYMMSWQSGVRNIWHVSVLITQQYSHASDQSIDYTRLYEKTDLKNIHIAFLTQFDQQV